MFFPELETIAKKHPELKGLIESLDKFFKEEGRGPFRIEIIADVIDEDSGQVKRVFDLLANNDFLEIKRMIQCTNCESVLNLPRDHEELSKKNEAFCDVCGDDVIYRESDIVDTFWKTISAPTIKKEKILASTTESEPSESLPEKFIKDIFSHTPIISYISKKIAKTNKPLSGVRVIIILHFLRDLVPFTQSLFDLGLDPKASHFFYKRYPYPQRDEIKRWLIEKGCNVNELNSLENLLKDLSDLESNKIRRLLIIEDGGYTIPLIFKNYNGLLKSMLGSVEQTMRGIWNDEEAIKNYGSHSIPIVSVAQSNLKKDFEPPHVAGAVILNLKNLLPDLALSGIRISVLGYGSIGKQISDKLRTEKSIVTVFDPDSDRRLIAHNDGFEVEDSVIEAIKDVKIIVGASGTQSIGRTEILSITHDAFLVSASSELKEFDIDALEVLSTNKEQLINKDGMEIGTFFNLRNKNNRVNLLANGYPINFWGMNSMPDQVSDLILTLILLGTVELCSEQIKGEGILSDVVDKYADKYELSSLYLEYHKG